MTLKDKVKRQTKFAFDIKKIEPEVIKKKIEQFLESDKSIAKLTSIFLGFVAVAGIMSVALAAPNLFKCYGPVDNKRKYKKRCNATIYYAKKRGYINKVEKGDESYYTLTQKGKNVLYFEVLKNLQITKPEQWDQRWRIVIFDIPNQYNKARDFLRDKLKQLRFKQVQKSVFICPWPCLKEIDLLRKAFSVKKYVTLIVAESIEGEKQWLKFFSLNSKG